jgi:hypothetical protein
LDIHLTRRHYRHRLGSLPDWYVDLEEMFQPIAIYGGIPSSTFGSTYAGSQSTSHSPRSTGDQ